jgi:predicted porin
MATAVITTSTAMAAAPPATNDPGVDMDVYGTLIPYFENVGTSGATPIGSMSTAYQVQSGNFTGVNHDRRFRMTSGTSHIGFRGFLPLIADDSLKLIWQVESPAPIDGEGPSNWAARNSHAGFSGFWGSIVYGNWDTPMRWVTTTSVNPIRGGFTGDMTILIGSPGFGVSAWNSDQTFTAIFEIPPNRAGFFRHEANTVQYWSPDIYGFSARLMFGSNEHRTAGQPGVAGAPALEEPLNPHLYSGSIGYDNSWLRLRYALEVHEDYFGMASLAGAGPGNNSPSSTDVGHLGLASIKINAGSEYETRLVVTGDALSYHTDVLPAGYGATNEFSREAVYGLLQQTFGSSHVWLAYGMATEGKCKIAGPAFANICGTKGLGAQYYTVGVKHDFTPNAGIYGIGYALMNDTSARYTTFPLLEARGKTNSPVEPLPNIGDVSVGSDTIGIGLGFFYTFTAKILGGDGGAAAAAKAEPAPAPRAEPVEAEEEVEARVPPTTEEPAEEPPTEEPAAEDEPAEEPLP